MGILGKIFGKKKEIDFDKLGINLSDSGKASLEKFANRKKDERMGDVMMIGDSKNLELFYIIYYAILFDNDDNVRFAALKRLPNFKNHSLFEQLIIKLDELPNQSLEPYYSMMLVNIGKITSEEFEKRASNWK